MLLAPFFSSQIALVFCKLNGNMGKNKSRTKKRLSLNIFSLVNWNSASCAVLWLCVRLLFSTVMTRSMCLMWRNVFNLKKHHLLSSSSSYSSICSMIAVILIVFINFNLLCNVPHWLKPFVYALFNRDDQISLETTYLCSSVFLGLWNQST